MNETRVDSFGLLIAYVLPGLTALWGVSYFSEPVRIWLQGPSDAAPTVGGFLYVTLASIAAGLTASTLRWLLLDTLHHRTGIPRPEFDFSRFSQHVAGYDVLTEIHYRYYQWHANSLVAIVFTLLARRTALGLWFTFPNRAEIAALCVAALLFAGSRDNLRRYYRRLTRLMGTENPEATLSDMPSV